jgi:hypothetical protein
VRGLNSDAKKEDVKQTIAMFGPYLICVQETKLVVIDNATIKNCLVGCMRMTLCFYLLREQRGHSPSC